MKNKINLKKIGQVIIDAYNQGEQAGKKKERRRIAGIFSILAPDIKRVDDEKLNTRWGDAWNLLAQNARASGEVTYEKTYRKMG